MAKYGDLILSGKSGHKYCFQTWPFGTRFRPVGAVYFVTKRHFANGTFRRARHEVLHIGQTASMEAPLGTQAEIDSFLKRGANCVCVLPAPSEARRMELLGDFVDGFGPLARL